MAGRTRIPSDWPDFLRNFVNKQELFADFCYIWYNSDYHRHQSLHAVMWSWRSRHQNANPPARRSSWWCYHLLGAHSWYWCCSYPHRQVPCLPFRPSSCWYMVAFGTCKNFVHIRINAICNALGREIYGTSYFSLLYWLWYNIWIFRKGKEVGMGYMEVLFSGDPSIPPHGNTSAHYTDCGRPTFQTSGMLLYCSLPQDKQFGVYQWGKEKVVLPKEQDHAWKPFHQHRTLSCSIANVLSTRLGSGQPVTLHNNRHLALKDGVGHWMVKDGFQYVSHNQLFLKPAVN